MISIITFIWAFFQALNPVILNGETVLLDRYEYLILEEDKDIKFQEIIERNDFTKIDQQSKNFGINNDVVWLKYVVENNSENEGKYFYINNSSLDSLELFVVSENEILESYVGGRLVDFYSKPILSKSIIFDINLPIGKTSEIFLKVKSVNKKIITSTITNRNYLENLINRENILFGIFTGVIVGLFFYNLFLFFSVRDKLYLIYVIHTVLVWFAQSSILGFTQEIFWPNVVWLNLRSGVIFSSLVSIVGIWFLRVFLSTDKFIPKLDKGFYFIYLVYAFILVNAFFFSITVSYQTLLVTQSIVVLYVLLAAFAVQKQGYRPARYYLLAWSVFMLGIFLFVLSEMGIIPTNDLTAYIMPLGSALEVVLLSFALADKINILKKEKEKEQAERLRVLKENEQLIREQNTMLEEKVRIRTDELEQALRNLQNTQSQLVSQEKMASLGQLTAGIAHEINNPINFVSSNITPLKRDIADIMEVIEFYRETGMNEFKEESKKKAKDLEEELELDYVLDEVDQLLKGMEEGAKRTVEIVKGLRLFSRVDEQDVKKVDIHDGINSTIILLNSSIPGKIRIVRDFAELPMVECLAGKINQVFMNIINNAVHALSDHIDTVKDPKIEIRTRSLGDHVVVEIEDNGPGMPDHVRQRIFEPFFTTKAVGKGTGLGLSIVYSIIENHKGTLEVNSEVGQGTTFIITLPIYQSSSKYE
ncbi:sensor histidine kinase [Algoriphagus sp. NBT04N3]|jgi:two-component system, NtrC family, sensor kinase|uniref:sensor histidine kinase n=1 Tax=Algoriphagus sp. NBT04N3 TaxID=2705473 RepID=UPI001C634A00|nr:7TM diverse intracellular signaling domain-containing protein [Algoriphagus sp. NBT04N3]QYH37783.1 sensor histidine kinase [Algoriphagus sp. NBT04N3]